MKKLFVVLLAVVLLAGCGPVCVKHKDSDGPDVAHQRGPLDTKAVQGMFARAFSESNSQAAGAKQSK